MVNKKCYHIEEDMESSIRIKDKDWEVLSMLVESLSIESFRKGCSHICVKSQRDEKERARKEQKNQ
jgi:hypothetical protein